MTTAGDILAVLESLSSEIEVDTSYLAWRFVHQDGRLQHLNVHGDGSVTVQVEPAEPALVPRGAYCYEAVEMDRLADGRPCLRTRPCPHWRLLDEPQNAFCDLLDHDDWSCMWDQVKVCGLNDPEDIDFEGSPDRTWMADEKKDTDDADGR